MTTLRLKTIPPRLLAEMEAKQAQLEALKKAEEIAEQKKKIKKTIRWLCKQYPKTFNIMKPLPLCLGMQELVLKDIKETKKQKQHPKIINMALKYYTKGIRYKEAVVKFGIRFNLDGTKGEKITEEHLTHAKKCIQQIHKYRAKHPKL